MSDTRESQLIESVHGISVRQRATGSAAIAVTLEPTSRFLLKEVRIHLSAAGGAGDLTISLDSGINAVYDVVLMTQDMTLITDLVYQPSKPLEFESLDKILISWANVETKTYGIEILYSKI